MVDEQNAHDAEFGAALQLFLQANIDDGLSPEEAKVDILRLLEEAQQRLVAGRRAAFKIVRD